MEKLEISGLGGSYGIETLTFYKMKKVWEYQELKFGNLI